MHIMIDLETLSQRPDATILEIGAVEFEPVIGGNVHVGKAFSVVVDIHKQGRHVDPDVLDFWIEQTREGNLLFTDSVSNPDSAGLTSALQALEHWLCNQVDPYQAVWSHGAAFDIPILNHAYMSLGRSGPPWPHRLVRDTRTFYMSQHLANHPEVSEGRVAVITGALGRGLRRHRALDDAIVQALEIQEAHGR